MTTNLPAGRCLHLVDVENLTRTPRPTTGETEACRLRYQSAAAVGSGDMTVVACNHGAAAVVAFAWPEARLRLRSGPNGADLALLEVLDCEGVANRFERVVIGSGDGAFAEAAACLADAGVQVTVVSNRTALSGRLRLAAGRVVLFDPPLPPAASLTEATVYGEAA